MTAPHDASGDAAPRHVLSIRAPLNAPSIGDVVCGVVTDVAEQRRRQRLPHVAITVDLGGSREPAADPRMIRATLTPVVAAACDAAIAPAPASDGPRLHEVVITAVTTPGGVEIEVADSGPGQAFLSADGLASARSHAERLGGSIVVAACPDGGTAVTLCLPSSHQHVHAIRPAA